MTLVPVMLLVVVFVPWELQMLPVSQVQLRVWVSVGAEERPHAFPALCNSTLCLMIRIDPLRNEHSLLMLRPFS